MNCTQGNEGNSVCTFACSSGYKLDDDSADSISCQDLDGDGDGEWSGEVPDCVGRQVSYFYPVRCSKVVDNDTIQIFGY